MLGGIYQIRNTQTGDCYVGSAVNFARRRRNHFSLLRAGRHHSIHLQRAYDKYGEPALEFNPLVVCDSEYALALEQRLLDAGTGQYNIAKDVSAVMRGRKHTLAACAKIREARIGTPHAPETLVKMRAAWQDPDVRAKHSAALKGKPKSTAHRAKLVAHLEKVRSGRAPEERVASGRKGQALQALNPDYREKNAASLAKARMTLAAKVALKREARLWAN